MTDIPLIWTTKGNVPVAALRHEVEWRNSPDQIIFIERYYSGDEVVKESAHVQLLTGVSMSGEASL
jgi:hypothetical protein